MSFRSICDFVVGGLIVLGCAMLLDRAVQAQSFFGSIVGAVTDPSGAAVPGARVTLTNTGTGETKSAEADAAGNYQFLNLIPGTYKADLERSGFKRFTQDQIKVLVQGTIRVDVQLQVGDVGQTVEVNAQGLALQTETATLSQAVAGRNVTEMPLNGRNVYNLIALVPGVVIDSSGANAAAPQIGGGVTNQNATYVDGAPMNTGFTNGTVAAPTQDTVEEFRVQTNSVNAEFGRFSGGVVTLTTKSGTNEFHGTAYEFLRNKVLNANTFFSNSSGLARPPFTQNQYGATLGGPIRRNKTFFFASWEGFAQRQGVTYLLNAPTARMKAGDFSELLPGTLIYDPKSSSTGTNRTPFQGNVIPAIRLDPTAVALAKLQWPAPDRPGLTNNFANNASSGSNNNTFSGRLDHNLSDRQRIFARFNRATPKPVLVSPYGNTEYTAGTRQTFHYNAVVGDTFTFSPTLIGDLRVAYVRWQNLRYPDQLGIDLTTIGWPAALNAQLPVHTLPQLCVTNYDFTSGWCQGNPQSVILQVGNILSLAPSLTKVAGSHTLKFGGEFRRIEANYSQSNNYSGNFSFTNAMTAANGLNPGTSGYSFASLMLGYGAANGTTNLLTLNAATTSVERYQGYYVTDTWVVNRKLTLSYGLRWEGLGPYYEKHDRQSVLQPGLQNPMVPYKGMIALANSSVYPNRGIQPHPWGLLSPRFGFAYRLSDKWVIRSGAGISFLPTDASIFSTGFGAAINSTTTPWVPSLDGGLTPYATLSNPFPTGVIIPPQRSPNYQQLLLGLAVRGMEPTNPYAYSEQFNFSIGRELPGGAVFEVAYAGLRGVHLYRYPGEFLNQLPNQNLALGTQLLQQVANPFYGLVTVGALAAPTVTYGQLLLPFPQYTGVTNTSAGNGNSVYNALQVKLEKRFSAGGTLLVSYTRSKIVGDIEQEAAFTSGVGAFIIQDNNNLRAERSLAAFDIPQNLVVSYVYDLPFGKGKKFLGNLPPVVNKLFSGWGVNGITTLQTGPPLGFVTATNLTNSYGGGSRPNVTAGCDKSVAGSAQSRVSGWFNKSCFTAPAPFTFGSESRTDPNLRGAGTNNWDFAAFKNTAITERFSLQFRAEIFNVANRVQFGLPNTTLGAATFGVVTNQVNPPRLVQLALRLKF
jgi:hypothetical protein